MVFGAISRRGASKLFIAQKNLKIDSGAYQGILDDILLPMAKK
jgi:hypothetical protein